MNLEILKQQKLKFKKKLNSFFKIIILCASILSTFQTFCADLIITTSGTYLLSDDILAVGDATNGTIRIQSSYVTLDLGGCFIKQNDATANCTAIVVDPGYSDLVIKNGTISGFTLNGISIGANCSKVNINNLIIENCTTSGASGSCITVDSGSSNVAVDSILMTNGNSSAISLNTVVDSVVSNYTINGFNVPTSDAIINLTSCSRIRLSGINISNSTFSASINYFFYLQNIYDSSFDNIVLSGNVINQNITCFYNRGVYNCDFNALTFKDNVCNGSGTTCYVHAFALSNSANNKFLNCNYINNSSPNSTLVPFLFSGSFTYSGFYFKNTQVIGNSVSTFRVIAFIGSPSLFIKNVFEDFLVLNNSISLSGIFFAINNASASYGNIFKNITISQNNAGDILYGFDISSTCYQNVIQGCNILGNTGTNSFVGINGFLTNSRVQDCVFERNSSTLDANSYGMNVTNNGTVFLRNVSNANGTTNPLIQNQLAGVPIGSMMTPGGGGTGAASTRINSVVAPWTNLRMTN